MNALMEKLRSEVEQVLASYTVPEQARWLSRNAAQAVADAHGYEDYYAHPLDNNDPAWARIALARLDLTPEPDERPWWRRFGTLPVPTEATFEQLVSLEYDLPFILGSLRAMLIVPELNPALNLPAWVRDALTPGTPADEAARRFESAYRAALDVARTEYNMTNGIEE